MSSPCACTAKRLLRVWQFDGLIQYQEVLTLLSVLADERKHLTSADTLLLLEHKPVFTVGKRGTFDDFKSSLEEITALGAEVVTIPRGGETTFHGPGQLVAYPIVNLRQLKVGARAWVEGLEDVMVRTTGVWGIHARGRVPGRTGVWVGERKVGALGVRISQGISTHGIALNVNTDLSWYKHIVPCGIPDKDVTSLERELRQPVDLGLVRQQFTQAFLTHFMYDSVLEEKRTSSCKDEVSKLLTTR